MSKTDEIQKSDFKFKAKVAVLIIVEEDSDVNLDDIEIEVFPDVKAAEERLRVLNFFKTQAGQWESSKPTHLAFARIVEREV